MMMMMNVSAHLEQLLYTRHSEQFCLFAAVIQRLHPAPDIDRHAL